MTSGLCQKHDDEVTKFYCLDCKEFICRDCTDDEHEDHVTKLISSYAKQEKKELSDHLDVVKEKLKLLKGKLVEAKQHKEKLQAKGDSDIKKVEELIDFAVKLLLTRKCHVVSGIKECTEVVKRPVEEYEKELSCAIDQMESCIQFGEHLLEPTGSVDNREVLGMKPQVVQRVAHLNELYRQCNDSQSQSHNDDVNIVLTGQEAVQKICMSLVYLPPCVQKCRVTGDGVKHGYKNMANTFIVQLKDVRGVGIIHQVEAIKVDIKRVNDGDTIKHQVTEEQDGGYKVTYQPRNVGVHKITVVINSVLLPGSPFTVQVLSPYCNHANRKVKVVTKYGEGKKFGMLWGVAVNSDQDVALTDSNNNCVIILDKDYKLKQIIIGNKSEQLNCPRGLLLLTMIP